MHEAGEAGGEGNRIEQPEHPAKGVMAGNAVLEGQKLPKERLLCLTKQRHVGAILAAAQHGADARRLYEVIYCARGEMENRIKECQLDLFAGRTSAATMAANQLRLWFASFAYVLLCGLRRIGLVHTQFAQATCGTIRLKLLKIGALVRISVRRVSIAMASACPTQHEFALAHVLLRRAGA